MRIGKSRLNLTAGIRLSKNLFFSDGISGALEGRGVFGTSSQALAISPQLAQAAATFGTTSAAQLPYLAQGANTFAADHSATATSQNFEAEYQAVLDYATTQGYTLPSSGQQILQNQLVLDLKSAGIWGKLDSFLVMATNGDSSFSLVDWVRLTTATAVNSPTFTENQGYNGNGSTSYIDTGIDLTILSNYSQNSASIFRYKFSNTTVGTTQTYDGNRSNIPTILNLIASQNSTSCDNYVNSGFSAMLINEANTIGTHLNVRSSANHIEAFINGSSVASSAAAASTGVPTTNYYIGGYNNAGSFIFPHNAKMSIYGFGSNLTAEQSDLHTAINTYMTSI